MATVGKGRPMEGKEYALPGPLAVSAISGGIGLLCGGTATVLQPSHQPGIRPSVIVAKFGIEGALLGGAFSSIRWALLETRIKNEITPSTRVYCSSIAGGLSAALAGTIMRKVPLTSSIDNFSRNSGLRPTVLGVLGGTIFGYVGQKGYNSLDRKNTEAITTPIAPKEPLWRRMVNSKYSPMSVLTNKQYEEILQEKLLRVDTEIAIIDDDIAKLRTESKVEKSKT
ncbi:hypothetical protein BLS_004119 [Venturia inaequalis]|uniref:Uncharacterized protein n=1 Tax=Venturia inaequalis TaxID=5025 RepID=A0A8H3V5I1_VENIN|nr:hypothetical protein BLS_004119 [Venturia inaequalis]KAE9994635.1 hypothetical protein EG327_006778 [Venturia inaequalis]